MPSPTSTWLDTRAELKRLNDLLQRTLAGDQVLAGINRYTGHTAETYREQITKLQATFDALSIPPGYEPDRKAIVGADGHVSVPLSIEAGGGYIHDVSNCPRCQDDNAREWRSLRADVDKTVAPGDVPF